MKKILGETKHLGVVGGTEGQAFIERRTVVPGGDLEVRRDMGDGSAPTEADMAVGLMGTKDLEAEVLSVGSLPANWEEMSLSDRRNFVLQLRSKEGQ